MSGFGSGFLGGGQEKSIFDNNYFKAFMGTVGQQIQQYGQTPDIGMEDINQNVTPQDIGGMPQLATSQYNQRITNAQGLIEGIGDPAKDNWGNMGKGIGSGFATGGVIGAGIGLAGSIVGNFIEDRRQNKQLRELNKDIQQTEANKARHIGMYNTQAGGYYMGQGAQRYMQSLQAQRQQQFTGSLVPQQGYSLL